VTSPKRLRVNRAYRQSCDRPLQAAAGERLSYERRASEWPGWLWCTDAAGRSSWVPEAWVSLEANRCVLQRDYSAVELDVEPGELLRVELTESGWAWVTRRTGSRGWVPLDHTEPA
jgi:hypothetical protein